MEQIGSGHHLTTAPGFVAQKGSLLATLHSTGQQVREALLRQQQRLDESLQQQDYLYALINGLPEQLWLKDTQGRYLIVNQAFAKALQQPAEQLIGKTDAELFEPQLALFHISQDKEVFSTNQAKHLVRQVDHEQNLRWLETYKTPVHSGDQLIGIVGSCRDVTHKQSNESQLKLSASVFTHAREGIFITNPDGIIVDVNQSFTDITGYGAVQAKGCTPNLLRSAQQDERSYRQMWQQLSEQGFWEGDLWSQHASGQDFILNLTISAVLDEHQQLLHYVGLLSDVTQMRQQQQQLEKIALYDQLTGLPNRAALIQQLLQLLRSNDPHELLAIAYLDLDGFKEVNDRHGHNVGDRMLLALAERVRQQLEPFEFLARIGGDEFVLLMPGLKQPQQGCEKISHLLTSLSVPVKIDDWMLSVSASIGITFAPQPDNQEPEQFIRQADHAMYQAKQDGKNRYHLFDLDKARSLRGHQETIQDIRQALACQQFELFYQPKVNMRTGELVGSEALIRWRHPDKGLIPPGLFLPAIEQHTLGVELGYWVMERAISQLDEWRTAGVLLPVSINISAYHLQQPEFVNRLQQLLRQYQQVDPALLQLEILETSALNDLTHVQAVMQACLRAGVSFALDDFGTGYSSLTYLKRLPAQVLKIDQSFVRDMLTDPDDLAILRGIIVLANEFNRDIVAEGVETTEHGEALLQLGCELAQGYGIARPMPANDFISWRQHWTPPPQWCQSCA